KQYLAEDEQGVINALKRDIDQFTRTTEEGSSYDLAQATARKLNEAVREQKRAETTLRTLKKRLIDGGDDQIRVWEEELDKCKSEQLDLQTLAKRITGDGEETDEIANIYSISLLKRKLKEADTKISEITETVQLHLQTSLIQKIAGEARQYA